MKQSLEGTRSWVHGWRAGVYLHLRNLSAFVISAENGESVLVAHLQGDEQSDSLD